ncbi:MAG: M13 family metallopeptidase, partial [Steroidobacterales bacterium]
MLQLCSRVVCAALGCLILSCTAADSARATTSGIDLANVDYSVRPQDNFYRYVNGKWLASASIPDDLPAYGSYWTLRDGTQAQLRDIIESAVRQADAAPGTEAAKIGRLYASFMDEALLERLGARPLTSELAHIASLRDKRDIPELIARLEKIGVTVPYASGIDLDSRDSSRYVFEIEQSGLGLPDRDYYLNDDDATLVKIRELYQGYISASLSRLGDRDAAGAARAIVALETQLARAQWTKVQNRDPIRTYNRMDVDQLHALAAHYDWHRYLAASGAAGKVSTVIVRQPGYLTGFAAAVQDTPLPVWKAYFRWHVLVQYAPYLSRAFVAERFAFYGTALTGVPEIKPRWKRGVALVDASIGEALGKLYVAQYFPPENKQRIEAIVRTLLEAYRQDIGGLDWMGAQTRAQALAKLAKITVKMAYPDKWRDYTKLNFTRDDLVGNVMRANRFEYARQLAHLGTPVDRSEWHMPPQTINAYYNRQMNEIVFPAAYLQPPMFMPLADDATNYGSVGSTIGHEISPGFDDRGSLFDGDGNLHDWWTAEDHARFAA